MNKCKSCLYHDRHLRTCDYILLEGKRRGCKIDNNCIRYERRDGRDRRLGVLLIGYNTGYHKPISPKLLARQGMYDRGLTDREIADVEGCSPDVIKSWRRRHGLVSQRNREETT